MEIKIESVEYIDQSAESFLEALRGHRFFAFYGEMGAGKTTFINALLRLMDVEDHTTSPTFSIVNEYFSPTYGSIFHFDFYRLKNEQEAIDIGVEDILYGDDYYFMEWPERVEKLLPEDVVKVTIEVKENCRLINAEI